MVSLTRVKTVKKLAANTGGIIRTMKIAPAIIAKWFAVASFGKPIAMIDLC